MELYSIMINVDKDNLFVGDVLDGSVKKFFIECYSIADTDYEEYENFKQQIILEHNKLKIIGIYCRMLLDGDPKNEDSESLLNHIELIINKT